MDVVALPMGEFTFAEGEEYAGQTGVVVAYAVRHPGGVFLFDTGFGFGNAELDDYYKVRARALPDVLERAGIDPAEITALANCHLHADHAGQNGLFRGIPIYVQPAEWTAAHTTEDYTILDWIDFPGARNEQVAGDHEVVPGIRLFATPGHSPGHQSLVVDTLTGRSSWSARRSTARASGAASRARARVRARRPTESPTRARSRAFESSTRGESCSATTTEAGRRESASRWSGYPWRAVLGGELAVPCTCNPLQQG